MCSITYLPNSNTSLPNLTHFSIHPPTHLLDYILTHLLTFLSTYLPIPYILWWKAYLILFQGWTHTSLSCPSSILLPYFIYFFNTIFVSSHMYPENPEGTQVIVGSMNMGYISDTARNRTHNLFRPKREPIPLIIIIIIISLTSIFFQDKSRVWTAASQQH